MRTRKLLIAAVIGCLIVGATGISAASAEEETIAGWTEEEFYAAAASMGVPEETYTAAWGDVALMERVPVAVEGSSSETSRAATEEEQSSALAQGALAPLAIVTATYSSTQTNPFGGLLTQLTMTKTFSANGVSVSHISATTTTASGFGWYFNGIVNSWNAYSTEGGRPNGGHTSYANGQFCAGSVGGGTECTNRAVQIKGLWNGTWVGTHW